MLDFWLKPMKSGWSFRRKWGIIPCRSQKFNLSQFNMVFCLGFTKTTHLLVPDFSKEKDHWHNTFKQARFTKTYISFTPCRKSTHFRLIHKYFYYTIVIDGKFYFKYSQKFLSKARLKMSSETTTIKLFTDQSEVGALLTGCLANLCSLTGFK